MQLQLVSYPEGGSRCGVHSPFWNLTNTIFKNGRDVWIWWTIIRYLRTLSKLVLHTTSYDLELDSHTDEWINVAIENNMKELSMFLSRKINISVCPRLLLMQKQLTRLRLRRCKQESSSGIKHPQLQKLNLQPPYSWGFEILALQRVEGSVSFKS